MPRFAALTSLLAVVVLLVSPPIATAAPCRRLCRPAIQRCVDAGNRRRRCKRQLIQTCKLLGQQSCDEAFLPPATLPPATTTSTTTNTTFPATTTTTQPDRLSLLLGQWAFTYTIIDTFTDHYNLTTIQQATGQSYDVVFGTNSDLGNSVIAGRTQDFDPGNTTGYYFALLDPESLLCEFFAFNVGGASSASGVVL